MELYKYTGSVAALTVRFGKAETITLYDSYDDSVAPVRLDVRGALAEYIKEIESTDSEERYMNLDWYYDFNMLLRRIEVPAGSVVECGYKSVSSADSAARELKSRCEKMGRRVFCWGYESVAEVQ